MKRTIAILGVAGIGMLGATVTANAAPDDDKKITICHFTGSETNPYVAETISLSALRPHAGDHLDIVPANDGDIMPNGQNLDKIAILNNGCVAPADAPVSPPVVPVVEPVVDPVVETVVPPVVAPVVPPVVETVVPPVVAPVVPPVVETVVPPVVAPVVPPVVAPTVPALPTAAAPAADAIEPAAKAAMAKPAPVANPGYNVQTAVGDHTGTGIPSWLATLTGLFTVVAALVLWRGGVRARNAIG